MKNTLVIALVCALALATGSAFAYSSDPPDARTGAPGESTCTACHSSFPLNSGAGSLSVIGLPQEWSPLTIYDVEIELADPDAQRWGYEFTILDANGNSVGQLATLDGESQLSTPGNRTYAKHTFLGTHEQTTVSSSWTVRWTSPAAGAGDVTLYVAGNAANNNSSSSGDRIYATSVASSEGGLSAVGVPALAAAELRANFPNPFNPRTSISYELAADMPVRLSVYALDGRRVRVLEDGHRATGPHVVVWDGLDGGGKALPSGIYLYRLQAGQVDETRRMALVR